MITRILATLDGSTLAGSVLPTVTELASGLGAEVILLTVLDGEVTGHFQDFAESEGMEVEDAIRSYLRAKAADLADAGVQARGELEGPVHRPVAEVVVEYAERNGVDLIALSTHGRSGVARWLLGSVAEKVVRGSDVPVLLVRPEEARRSG